MFVLASSVCKCLQCLISALTQGADGGHSFRLTRSAVLWGGRNTAEKYPWRVWGALAVSGPPWVCPLTVCLLSRSTSSGSRLLCAHFSGLSRSGSGSPVLHKGTDFGPAFRALPRSEQPRRPGAWRTHSSSRAERLFTSRASPSVSWVCRGSAISVAPCVCPLGSWSPAATLLVDVNCPGSQEALVRHWGPAHSLVEDAVSGVEIAPRLPALAVPRLPLPPARARGRSAAG